jgi:transcriptional regulator NrdR family protein
MVTVVKRRGHKETFDEKKVYASIYAACMDCSLGVKKCEGISEHITSELKNHLRSKREVNSTEIFGFVMERLARFNEPSAFMYETHREMPKA